jgi:hypothetical protein
MPHLTRWQAVVLEGRATRANLSLLSLKGLVSVACMATFMASL